MDARQLRARLARRIGADAQHARHNASETAARMANPGEPPALRASLRAETAPLPTSGLVSAPVARGAAEHSDAPFWNPRSGAVNGALLRQAIVMRGWTVAEFAVVCSVSPACLYRALGGYGVTDRIAIRIFDGLRQRQPLPPIPELSNARRSPLPGHGGCARSTAESYRAFGAAGRGDVCVGDARQVMSSVPRELIGRVALVLTSPPYGSSAHGRVRVEAGEVVKRDLRYSEDASNLAYAGLPALIAALQQIFAACASVLKPGGVMVVTARPWRRDGMLVDFPYTVLRAAETSGLVPEQRLIALLAGLQGGRLVPRASLFQLQQVRKARSAGLPLRLIAHEDVLVLWKP
jgi:hypothetical protein